MRAGIAVPIAAAAPAKKRQFRCFETIRERCYNTLCFFLSFVWRDRLCPMRSSSVYIINFDGFYKHSQNGQNIHFFFYFSSDFQKTKEKNVKWRREHFATAGGGDWRRRTSTCRHGAENRGIDTISRHQILPIFQFLLVYFVFLVVKRAFRTAPAHHTEMWKQREDKTIINEWANVHKMWDWEVTWTLRVTTFQFPRKSNHTWWRRRRRRVHGNKQKRFQKLCCHVFNYVWSAIRLITMLLAAGKSPNAHNGLEASVRCAEMRLGWLLCLRWITIKWLLIAIAEVLFRDLKNYFCPKMTGEILYAHKLASNSAIKRLLQRGDYISVLLAATSDTLHL